MGQGQLGGGIQWGHTGLCLAPILYCNDLEDGVERERIRQFKAGRESWILEKAGLNPVLSGDVG